MIKKLTSVVPELSLNSTIRFISPVRAVLFLVMICSSSVLALMASYEWLVDARWLTASSWDGVWMILFSTGVIGVSYLLALQLATGIVEMKIDNSGIAWRWKKRYCLSLAKEQYMYWEEVDDYVFQPDNHYEQFRLTLRSGKRFRFYHLYNEKNDGYGHFVSEFRYQLSLRAESAPIKMGRSFYETKLAMILLVVMGILISVSFVVSLFFSGDKLIPFGILGMMGGGISYYAYHVIGAHRKKQPR